MSPKKVLLIGWDGADWQHIMPLLQGGQMPTLQKLISEGVWGNVASLHPMMSPMLWNSVATGKYATKHGICGFFEPDPTFGGVRPVSSLSRRSRAIWNILHYAEHRCSVVNWWASHPVEKTAGCVVANTFADVSQNDDGTIKIPVGTVHPTDLAQQLACFIVHPAEVAGEQILPFIPLAAEIDQVNDLHLRDFRSQMAECLTTHSITTAVMQSRPWDFMATYYTAIDHFAHRFMQYHPPRRPHISEDDFRIYHQVMTGVYRFHDMMLERLLYLAGPDTTVILCSDHGFQSGAGRLKGIPREPAGPAAWHRPFGIFVMRGPGVHSGERVYGASLLDIAPTILHMFDLPVGQDMDGRVLIEAFVDPKPVLSIPSWEKIEGDFADPDSSFQYDRPTGAALVNQFAALGYVDDPSVGAKSQAETAEVEALFNLARCHKSIQEFSAAQAILESLVDRRPWEDRFIIHLADCYQLSGQWEAGITLLSTAYSDATINVDALILRAKYDIHFRDETHAEYLLQRADSLAPMNPVVLAKLGDLFLRKRNANAAISRFERALEIDPDLVEAHAGLSTAHLRLGNLQQAIDSALAAIDLVYRYPRAHLNFGIALARSGQHKEAIAAFESLLQIVPNSVAATRWLAFLYSHVLSTESALSETSKKATAFRQRLDALIEAHHAQAMVTVPQASKPRWLQRIPNETERFKRLLAERPDQAPTKEPSGRVFWIVSGIPRSGTSLMMQLLRAGGMQIKTDALRSADENNPQGYLEWEEIKSLSTKPELLDDPQLDSTAIKITSPLLRAMPERHKYKIVFMRRNLNEIAHSQHKMLHKLGMQEYAMDLGALVSGLQRHLKEIDAWITKSTNVDVLNIHFDDLLNNPAAEIDKLIEFFGKDALPTSSQMLDVVDRSLYRSREGTNQSPPS